MATLELKQYVHSQYGSGYAWQSATSYGKNNGDNNSFYVGGSDSHYRARLYFTIPSDTDIAASEKLVLTLKGFGQNGGTLWTQRTRGYLSTTNLSSSDYGAWDTLASPVLSYLYKDAAGASRITGSYSSSSGNDVYLIFNTTTLQAGGTYYIYLLPYGSDTDAMDKPTWTNTWMDWENNSDNGLNRLSLVLTYKQPVTISYNLNGGSGTIPSTTLTAGVEGSITTSVPTAPKDKTENAYTVNFSSTGCTSVTKASDTSTKTISYKFKHWSENADGTGNTYTSGKKITTSSSLTLYAQYEVKATVYNAITSAGATKDTSTSTRTVTLKYGNGTADATRSSTSTTTYTMQEWRNSSGTKVVNPETSFTPNKSETLTAYFSQSSTEYTSISLPVISRTGYTFDGWYTSDGTYINNGGNWIPTGTVTVQAKWTPEKRTITIYDPMSSQIVYSAEVDYDSSFTIPDFGLKRGVSTADYLSDVQLTYIDEYAGKEQIEFAKIKVHVIHVGDIYDVTNDDLTWSGDSFTVRYNTELQLCYVEEEDTPLFITFTTIPKPASRFGYTFAGWSLSYDNETNIIAPDTLYSMDDGEDYYFHNFDLYLYGVWEKAVSADANVLYFNKGGTMKKAKGTYVKVNGAYKPALAIFVKVNGKWRTKSPS